MMGVGVASSREYLAQLREHSVGAHPFPTTTAPPASTPTPTRAPMTTPYTPSAGHNFEELASPTKWGALPWYISSLWHDDPVFPCESSETQLAGVLKLKETYAKITSLEDVTLVSPVHPTYVAHAGMLANGTLSLRVPHSEKWSYEKRPFLRSGGTDYRRGTYQVVTSLAYHKGELYGMSSATRTVRFAGIFTTVGGLWGQPMTRKLILRPSPTIHFSETISLGVYLPANDYSALWHFIAETMFPIFHAVLPIIHAEGGTQRIAILQETRIPNGKRIKQGMIELMVKSKRALDSCHISPSECLRTELGKMLLSFVSGRVFNSKRSSSVHIKRMIIGLPTTCVPIWGNDGFVQAAAGVSSPECTAVSWLWRKHWLHHYNLPGYGRRVPSPIVPQESHFVWASRKHAWARRIINEDDVLERIASTGARVTATDFKMTMKEQFRMLQGATHFVAPHGAALVHAMALPRGAVFISIDVSHPPFTGLVSEVAWIHTFHFKGTLECAKSQQEVNSTECKIFRRPPDSQHKNSFSKSEHNNHISVPIRPFMRLVDATFAPLEDLRHSLQPYLHTLYYPPNKRKKLS